MTEQEQLSLSYSDLKDKYVQLQNKYRDLYKHQQAQYLELKKYKEGSAENEHIQMLETVLQNAGLLKELEKMATDRWVSGKRHEKVRAERDRFIDLYWQVKDELNTIIRGREYPEPENI